MIIAANDQTNYQQSLQTLEDLLDNAYWSATSIQAKDAITSLTQNISDILTTLNQGALDTNSASYTPLKAAVSAANTKLQTAQTQINNWVHVITVATQVTSAIDQVINQYAKMFPV